jgi:hypothetical protein
MAVRRLRLQMAPMSKHLRLYDASECGADGYPLAWHDLGGGRGVKHLIRDHAGNRCVRCGHPYTDGAGEWSACDLDCRHGGPFRVPGDGCEWQLVTDEDLARDHVGVQDWRSMGPVQAHWRILTVHHLRLGDDAKRDLRWWNLAALCQRCHLQVQGKVLLERVWPWEHSEWFKPYAAGWYAHSYLGEDLTRDEVDARLDELLALELVA